MDDIEIELAVLVALFSAKTNVIINQDLIFTGEISLSGKIKASSNIESKVIAAKKAGFQHVLGANLRENYYNGYEGIESVLGVVRRLVRDSKREGHGDSRLKNR